jgi:hypothetical protein
MNISQRLTKLEQVTSPIKDPREPLLITFIDGNPDTGDTVDVSGILHIYDGVPATQYVLDKEQLAEYKATVTDRAREVFLSNIKPRAISV